MQEAGTITGGAAASYMTLASASERIRGMEDSLGSPLLSRAPRGVQLTPAGRTLAHHAQLVLRQIDQLQGELGDYGAGIKGHVRLLCNSSALAEHLPQPLSAFLTAHPGVSVDLEERASDDIVDALRAGLADVGVVSDAADVEGLQAFDFCADPLVLIVPAGHALAEPKSAALIDVVGQPFVGLRDGSAFQAHLDRQAGGSAVACTSACASAASRRCAAWWRWASAWASCRRPWPRAPAESCGACGCATLGRGAACCCACDRLTSCRRTRASCCRRCCPPPRSRRLKLQIR